uniref:Uncharacterized protein LOC114345562 n=1 Tax=Diabrotica virgifera virgifera TaxID=50390 RepID=A0A6P7GQJ3_DIAVI
MICAAHTLQLAIQDALSQDKQIGKVILDARRVVRVLRTQTFLYMLRKQNLKKPIIDCQTRWGSTFDMLKRLLEFKSFCTEMELTRVNKFKNLSESHWDKIREIVSVLEPVQKCTIKLQYEQLTIVSFFSDWQECKLCTEKLGFAFARQILNNTKKREKYY